MKNRSTKRTLTVALALILVLGSFAVSISAEEPAQTALCPCCEASPEWVEVNSLTENPFSAPGHYRLTETITLPAQIALDGTVTIDLNGFDIYAAEGCRAFLVNEGGTLSILDTSEAADGGIVGNDKVTGSGGLVYVYGTLNLYSGRLVGTAVPVNGPTVCINSAGTVNIHGGTVEGGSATVTRKYGGNIYNNGKLNLYDGLITGGSVICDNSYGGNIYNIGTFNMYGGTIENGIAYDHGGNLFCGNGSETNIRGGLITGGEGLWGENEDGSIFGGNGGNIYITGYLARLYIYGGTISDGALLRSYGGNLMVNSGAQVYMYGGTIENGAAKTGANITVGSKGTLSDGTEQFSAMYILGGTINAGPNVKSDILKRNVDNTLAMYNCRYNGIQDQTFRRAECACYMTDDAGITFWHKGDCTDCLFALAVAEQKVAQVLEGRHNYQRIDAGTYTCDYCQHTYYGENVVAALDGDLYEDLAAAFAAAGSGDYLQLFSDGALQEAVVGGFTLDLNGYTLTADVFTSATSGDVIDSSPSSAGKLVCPDVTLAANNSTVPMTLEDGIHFCRLDFTQWTEPVDENTTKVKFYFTQRAAETLVDDAILAGNGELGVQVYLTWKNSAGKTQKKTVVFDGKLLRRYALLWDGRVFVTTITGTENISSLTCTYQITSTASSGSTLSAPKVSVAPKIRQQLSWDAINSFPLKKSDMTEQEMRDAIVDFMYFTKTYLWTPSESVYYARNTGGTADKMLQGTIYGGLPYVGVASGNCYRMMDYINEYGILDMRKALPALNTKDSLAMSDLKYFGSQCSISVYWGWGRLLNSVAYQWTYHCVPNRGFIILGDMVIEDIDQWTAAYNTTLACHENGEQVMYGNYAAAKKADGLVYYIQSSSGDGAGHLMMLYEDAHVVYNEDGTINGDESYLVIIDQGQSWKKLTNQAGDSFSHKGNIALKKTFKAMYDYGYVAFTFPELAGLDPIEESTVSLTSGETTLIDGVIAETDRSYNTTVTTEDLTWAQLAEGTVRSNYGIADVYVMLYDESGKEIYKHAVRAGYGGNKNLAFEEEGAMVTTWGTKPAEGTYTARIEVQLATGERPIIYTGKLAV
ncbi:MAG: hypothetical protein IKA47_01215 [Oscillospiraceae bacterium]|nr:hypothetical protein [Oscillospiraceae bacterium]